MRLDDPELVRREYASEDCYRARRAVFTELVEGPNAEDLAFETLAGRRPGRVLEVGSGFGDLSERVARDLGAEVVALDLSPRMVELARARGVDARVGDVQDLPFPDGEFDAAIANWTLHHVPDVDRAVAELARILCPEGCLVAATFGDDHLLELWELLDRVEGGDTPPRGARGAVSLSFSRENGGEILERRFARVERRDALGTVVFDNAEAVHRYVASTILGSHLAQRVAGEPAFQRPFRARSSQTLFVAEKAGG